MFQLDGVDKTGSIVEEALLHFRVIDPEHTPYKGHIQASAVVRSHFQNQSLKE